MLGTFVRLEGAPPAFSVPKTLITVSINVRDCWTVLLSIFLKFTHVFGAGLNRKRKAGVTRMKKVEPPGRN